MPIVVGVRTLVFAVLCADLIGSASHMTGIVAPLLVAGKLMLDMHSSGCSYKDQALLLLSSQIC